MSPSPFFFTLIAALANVAGAAAVASRSRWSVPALEKMIALSAGFMVSVALLDLAPEAIDQHGSTAGILILAGFLLVHLTQHTLVPHFHFGEEVHEVGKGVGMSALAGMMLHTFVDGVAIASGFSVPLPVPYTLEVTLAVSCALVGGVHNPAAVGFKHKVP